MRDLCAIKCVMREEQPRTVSKTKIQNIQKPKNNNNNAECCFQFNMSFKQVANVVHASNCHRAVVEKQSYRTCLPYMPVKPITKTTTAAHTCPP